MQKQVKNLPAMQAPQEVQVQSLGWEDPLEKEIVAHSSTLAWRIPWTEQPGGLWSMGLQSHTCGAQASHVCMPCFIAVVADSL